MLAFPGFTRSLIDSLLDDDFAVHPLEFVTPRGDHGPNGTIAQRNNNGRRWPGFQLAVPHVKDGKYTVNLDLRQFSPEDVQVKLDDKGMLHVKGKYEKKDKDSGSFEYREYSHSFSVPEHVQREQLTSKLDKNGLLKIEAPVKNPDKQLDDGVKNIPIEFVKKH